MVSVEGEIFSIVVDRILSDAKKEKRLLVEPGIEELREWSKKDFTTTVEFGQKRVETRYENLCFLTRITSRSAPQTFVVWNGDDARRKRACIHNHEVLGEQHAKLLRDAASSLNGEELICVQRAMGSPVEGLSFECRLIVPRKFARLAFMLDGLLFSGDAKKPADMTIVMIPDFSERKILVNPGTNTTFVLGTDYFGEIKKGCLRMISEAVREKHAGYSFHMGLQTRKAGGREKCIALAGLSGTGKTTLTLNGANKKIHQDDFIFIIPNSNGNAYYVVGPEKGFYVKTEDLTNEAYPGLWQGLTRREALLENVFVNEETGEIETLNHKVKSCKAKNPCECKNGRAVIPRKNVPDTDCPAGTGKLDVMGLITRRADVFPPVVKLSPEQFVAVFCVGPSIKTSAADPSAKGEPVMEYGTDPFHIGDKAEYANKLLEFLRAHAEIELVMMNTGRVGKKEGFEGIKIMPFDSQAVLDGLTNGAIEWVKDARFGWLSPKSIPGVSKEKLYAHAHYSDKEYDAIAREVLVLYAKQLEKISLEMPGSVLDEAILSAFPRK